MESLLVNILVVGKVRVSSALTQNETLMYFVSAD